MSSQSFKSRDFKVSEMGDVCGQGRSHEKNWGRLRFLGLALNLAVFSYSFRLFLNSIAFILGI